MESTMRAVVLERSSAAEELHTSRVPVPRVKPGWVLVQVEAFGLNHSEVMLRAFEAEEDHIRLPRILGIECVGVIADPSDSRFKTGDRVVALMGGMGRSFDGSYAEYALLPESIVFSVDSDLPWDQMAAIPETWFTAWGSLFECLRLQSGESLLIRGGTSALGLAALQIARSLGCVVTATTRSQTKAAKLLQAGADVVLLDDETLADRAFASHPHGFDTILELVGPSTLLESMHLAGNPGRVCMSGVLGNQYELNGFDPIKDIPNGVSLSGFFSNYPDQKTIDAIFSHIAAHDMHPIVGARFTLDRIGRAHALMERSGAFGKVVATID